MEGWIHFAWHDQNAIQYAMSVQIGHLEELLLQFVLRETELSNKHIAFEREG
jgi:hypothetical protein